MRWVQLLLHACCRPFLLECPIKEVRVMFARLLEEMINSFLTHGGVCVSIAASAGHSVNSWVDHSLNSSVSVSLNLLLNNSPKFISRWRTEFCSQCLVEFCGQPLFEFCSLPLTEFISQQLTEFISQPLTESSCWSDHSSGNCGSLHKGCCALQVV